MNAVLDERKNKNQITDQIWVKIRFRNYKYNPQSHFNHNLDIRVDFKSDAYMIVVENNTQIEKAYNEYLNEEEVNQVVRTIGQKTLSQLKKKGMK